ncbi:MAG: flavin reductase family protein [Anaerolineae bacterium]
MREVPASQAIALQRPEWIVLIVSRRADGFVDVMPAGWVMRASGAPPMFAVAVNRANYTNDLIRGSGEFVLAFPSAGMGSTVQFCGSRSGRSVDKVREGGLGTTPALHLATPLLADAYLNFECKLSGAHEAGDHTVFVGEVVAAHAGEGGGPLVNFGDTYALAQPMEGTAYRPGAL